MKFLIRIIVLFKRQISANKFGINYVRASNWTLPKSILHQKKTYSIHADDINGTGARDAFLDIFLDDVYNLIGLKKYIKINRVLDIGGHSGFFSMYCKLLIPESIIHCYEPNPQLANFINNQSLQTGFEYFPEAVGSISSFVSLQMNYDSVLNKTNIDEHGFIKQTSLKECINRIGGYIDLLKLDCEGAEWDILTDTETFENIKIITMEYHLINETNINELKMAIKNINFHILKLKKTGPTWGILIAINSKLL
jgi:FkbM family methyltransferase